MRKNQHGFAHLHFLPLVLVVLLIGALVTVYFMNNNHKNDGSQQSQASTIGGGVGPDCGTTKPLLKTSPVALSDLSTIIPMGNFAPPGHIGPTPHMYYNFLNTGTPTNIIPAKTTIHAPGDITITAITLFDNGSAINPFNSYRIDFSVCKQVTGYFIHVVGLSDKLAAIMKPPYDHTQTSKISGSKDEHTYQKNVNIKLTAGVQKPVELSLVLIATSASPEVFKQLHTASENFNTVRTYYRQMIVDRVYFDMIYLYYSI